MISWQQERIHTRFFNMLYKRLNLCKLFLLTTSVDPEHLRDADAFRSVPIEAFQSGGMFALLLSGLVQHTLAKPSIFSPLLMFFVFIPYS